MSLNINLSITLSLVVLCASTFTLFQLGIFLSSHNQLQLERNSLFANIGQSDLFWSQIVADVFLVGAFIVQHSLQNHQTVKNFLFNHGCGACERLLYNLGSCISLLALMYLWQPIPSFKVWEVSTLQKPLFWWPFFLIHSISWLIIYSGCYIMDITEFLGVKQVSHNIQDLPDPMSLKSEGLRRFYSHMRHPSFSAMTVILFFHPVMQIDRFLLAYAFVSYTISRTQVDDIDYAYQKRLRQRKERDLNSNGFYFD